MEQAYRSVLVFFALGAMFYLGVCVLLYYLQTSLLYYPTNGLPSASHITLKSDEESINVSMIQKNGLRAVIYFGGNAEDVSTTLPALQAAFPDAAIYALHYRGYNGSSGAPSEVGLVADGCLLFDYVSEMHSEIILIGRSLGSGIAVQVAASRDVTRLVLVTPYNSILELAQTQYPIIPVRLLLRDTYESGRFAPSVKSPVTIIMASNDQIIPRESTEKLKRSFPSENIKIVVLPGTDHNTISSHSAYIKNLAD